MTRSATDGVADFAKLIAAISGTLEELAQFAAEADKRLHKLEREAETRSKTAHYPPVRPLREPSYRTLGRKIADESGVELD